MKFDFEAKVYRGRTSEVRSDREEASYFFKDVNVDEGVAYSITGSFTVNRDMEIEKLSINEINQFSKNEISGFSLMTENPIDVRIGDKVTKVSYTLKEQRILGKIGYEVDYVDVSGHCYFTWLDDAKEQNQKDSVIKELTNILTRF